MLSKISRSLTQAQKVSSSSRIWLISSLCSALSSSPQGTSAARVSEPPRPLIQGKYCKWNAPFRKSWLSHIDIWHSNFDFAEFKPRSSSCNSPKSQLWETSESSHSEKSQSLSSMSDHSVSTFLPLFQPDRPLLLKSIFLLIFNNNNYRLYHPFKWN